MCGRGGGHAGGHVIRSARPDGQPAGGYLEEPAIAEALSYAAWRAEEIEAPSHGLPCTCAG